MPPTGRGLHRLVNDERTGRCPACGRAWPRRVDGTLIAHAGRAGDAARVLGKHPLRTWPWRRGCRSCAA